MTEFRQMPGLRMRTQQGFTMLEVLVALLILLIGLLGLAGLLVTTQQSEVEAYQRKQATLLVQDMIGRITANRVAAPCYAITTDTANGSPALGTGYTGGFLCAAGSAAQQARGSADLQAWNNALIGTDERKGAANVGAIIEARGCVTSPAAGLYTISVAWRGLAPTVAPPAAFACGKDQYKDATSTADERLRRVMSITIRIANLSA